MRTFEDAKGRTWTLELNVSALRRVRDLVQIDLAEVVEKDNALLLKLYSRPETISDAVWGIIYPQAAAMNVGRAEFDEALSGEALHRAKTALLDEITGFFVAFLPAEGELLKRWRELMEKMATELIRKSAEQMAQAVSGPPPPESGSPSGSAPGSAA